MTAPPAGPPLLRIVGPPASGKTLLITALVEALRQRGHLVASSAPRAGATATVITSSSGARVTVERALTANELRALVAQVDPRAALLLAEACDEPGPPAVEIAPPGGPALHTPDRELLAVVAASELAGDFPRFDPGEADGLAELIERRLLAAASHAPDRPAPRARRWWRRRAGA